ncbi:MULTISPECIES: hypothetical protein [Pseudomonas]|uniref:Uncharacterized protein n=1 Tax=Pseudomonas aeruginosa TaxID=287 RepID=A0AAQ3LM52_PSEAI|nr:MULTISPECIES: hypothetical protein [Pseudomonas]EIU4789681.1 hypothetical protein [Pseudomonas aeruginosa]EKP5710316.1 hypothetical protein [Pseudomonas aeruginosa]EKV8092687.1 hypothetical protein [Pseudomonas aeruginosa]EKW4466613.1 hypothetical protein [Pseudomonas aeruginosa]EKW6389318.1 hypothetical protein [Pseudomonas aeruginosa]
MPDLTDIPAAAPAHLGEPPAAHDAAEQVRCQVLDAFQATVDARQAWWRTHETGRTELHLASGEIYLLQRHGVARLR